MTEREALKLALEAIEHLSHNARKTGVEMGLAFVVADEAITACKQALAQPEQSQVEETLRYEIDALEAKLAECRAQQQESVAKRLMDCNDCGGTGVDGDVDDRGLTIDVECRSCAGSGKSRYFGSCTNGGRCLQGCLNTEGCYWEKRVAKVQPEQPAQQEPVQTIPSFTQLQQIIKNLEHCLSRDSKQEFLRVWIRDWTEHKLSQNTPPPQPEPVIDKSAAVRIATALGWEPKRKPLEGVIDVQPIGYHSLQLIFRSQTDIAKFKAAHGIKE